MLSNEANTLYSRQQLWRHMTRYNMNRIRIVCNAKQKKTRVESSVKCERMKKNDLKKDEKTVKKNDEYREAQFIIK